LADSIAISQSEIAEMPNVSASSMAEKTV
jgi:hypothetical protein